jgi:hypothetical protein
LYHGVHLWERIKLIDLDASVNEKALMIGKKSFAVN